MAEFTEAVKKGDETMNHDIVGKPLKKGDYEIVNFSSLRNCKNEKKSVSSGREPKPGDVIWADRNVKGLPYNHCGIYEGNNSVIHFSAPEGLEINQENAVIHRTTLDVFRDGCPLKIIDFPESFPAEETLRRARSRIGERDYDFTTNNCDHFATWCKTGRHGSLQVDTVKKTIKSMGELGEIVCIMHDFAEAIQTAKMEENMQEEDNVFFNDLENELNDKTAFNEKMRSVKDGLTGKKSGFIAQIWDKVQLIWDYVQSPDVPWTEKVMPLAALAYLVMPIDLIPDMIPVLGLADDAGVLAYAFSQLHKQLEAFSNGTLQDIEPSFITKVSNAAKAYIEQFKAKHLEYPVTYQEAMIFFSRHKNDSPKIVRGVMLKAEMSGKLDFTQVFLDKNNDVVCTPEGIPYGRRLITTGLDDELTAAFKDKNMVIVE